MFSKKIKTSASSVLISVDGRGGAAESEDVSTLNRLRRDSSQDYADNQYNRDSIFNNVEPYRKSRLPKKVINFFIENTQQNPRNILLTQYQFFHRLSAHSLNRSSIRSSL